MLQTHNGPIGKSWPGSSPKLRVVPPAMFLQSDRHDGKDDFPQISAVLQEGNKDTQQWLKYRVLGSTLRNIRESNLQSHSQNPQFGFEGIQDQKTLPDAGIFSALRSREISH